LICPVYCWLRGPASEAAAHNYADIDVDFVFSVENAQTVEPDDTLGCRHADFARDVPPLFAFD